MSSSDAPPLYDEAVSDAPRLPARHDAEAHAPRLPPRRDTSYEPPVQHAIDIYNPNDALPFKYPNKYFCRKCKNVGYRADKGGKQCKDCWRKFFKEPPPQRRAQQHRPPQLQTKPPVLGHPQYQTYGRPVIQTSSTRYVTQPGLSVLPGDPRIGGALCWRCGGSGRDDPIMELISLFMGVSLLCSVCRGAGRTF